MLLLISFLISSYLYTKDDLRSWKRRRKELRDCKGEERSGRISRKLRLNIPNKLRDGGISKYHKRREIRKWLFSQTFSQQRAKLREQRLKKFKLVEDPYYTLCFIKVSGSAENKSSIGKEKLFEFMRL